MTPPLTPGAYAALRTVAAQAKNVERCRLALQKQVRAFGADGWPAAAMAWSDAAVPVLQKVERELKRECEKVARGSAYSRWVEDTMGLGRAVFLVLGLLPPVDEFRSVRSLWKYCGLDVRNGRAPRLTKGTRAGFSSVLRAYVLYRLGESCVRVGAGPYREVYDRRKEHTRVTHPPMLEEAAGCSWCDAAYRASASARAARSLERERQSVASDCCEAGGPHWSDGRRHRDAVRVAAKAILRDMWRVAHGQEPGGVALESVSGVPGQRAPRASNILSPAIRHPTSLTVELGQSCKAQPSSGSPADRHPLVSAALGLGPTAHPAVACPGGWGEGDIYAG